MQNLFAELHRFKSYLGNVYDLDEAESITQLVFQELFQIQPHELRLARERNVEIEQKQQLDDILQRLVQHEPVQYILGFSWFMNDRYLVNRATLIPRPETEELVHWIIDEQKNTPTPAILDLGTGSGCIAIALKKRLPSSSILAIDKHESAVHTARINTQQVLSKTKNNQFFVQDMLDPLWWDTLGTFDIIVSNPPYVRELEKKEMGAHVLNYEPETALFVPDDDPLLFYRGIAQLALTHLKPTGCLYFEINAAFGQEMRTMLDGLGYVSELKRDMFGKDRMVKACLRS